MTTRDLGLIAALLSLGYKETAIYSENLNRIEFEFGKDTVQATKDFYSNQLMVPAQEYHQNIKMVKNRLFYIKRSGQELYK